MQIVGILVLYDANFFLLYPRGIIVNGLLAVGIGGFIGAILRYGISEWMNTDTFPYGTLAINIFGSIMMGLLMMLLSREYISHEVGLLFCTGMIGSFTTMSAFSFETMNMWNQSQLQGILYAMVNMIICPIGAFLGWKIGTFMM